MNSLSKGWILVLLMLVGCFHRVDAAEPNWENIGGGNTYVDQASIERRDSLLVARLLTNFDAEQSLSEGGKKYRSSVTQRAFKCDSMQATTVSFELFAERDAKGLSVGKGVNEEADSAWRDAKPGTQGRALLEFVCSHAPSP